MENIFILSLLTKNRMEAKDLLKKFGLGEYEALAYSTLLSLGSGKASVIGKDSGIPQSKVYEVLEQLANKQLVEFVGGRPKEFRAIPPQVALTNLLEERKRELKELEESIKLLQSIKPVKQNVIEGIWTAKGRGLKEFVNRVCEMFSRVEKYAYVISRDFTYSPKLGEAVKECVRRGADVRIIAMKGIDEKNYYQAKWYYSNKVQIRIFVTNVHPRIMVADDKEVLIRLDHNPTKQERFPFTSLYSTDPALVKVFDSYVKSIWKSAKEVNLEKFKLS
jgi:sugar-specific transcriptional regulator TrmB